MNGPLRGPWWVGWSGAAALRQRPWRRSDPEPIEIEQLRKRREELGIDQYDEVDKRWAKLDYYAAHDVDELLIIDPQEQRVYWFALRDSRYEPMERSALIELGPAELAGQVLWP